MSKLTLLTLGTLLSAVKAGIVADGPWTGNDFYDDGVNLGVSNGVPYSNDPAITARIQAAMAADGDVLDYMDKPNVQRVMSLVDATDWEDIFPIRDPLYEYEGFLRAVGKYEAFCGETQLAGYTLEQTCKRELATLFAHFG